MNPLTPYDELEATWHDDSKREVAQRVERKSNGGNREKPPGPNPWLERTSSLEELERELTNKAKEYAALAERSRAAEWDQLNGGDDALASDEVNYRLLETFASNVAARLRRELEREM